MDKHYQSLEKLSTHASPKRVFALISVVLALVAAFALAGCSSGNTTSSDDKILIAYYSATGNTEKVANLLEDALDADMYKIEAADPYSDKELSARDDQSRPYIESQDTSIRPKIASQPVEDPTSYDKVYLGYPIWYGKAPNIIYTFLEDNDFSNAEIFPFCTSGSSDITESVDVLKKLFPDLKWENGCRFGTDATNEDVDAWLSKD